VEWLDHSARLLKELAPRQLVSTGSEGTIGSLGSEAIYFDAHRSPAIDYLTLHVWVKNWNWLTEFRLGPQYEAAAARALAHVEQHIRMAEKAGKPLIMEEFGIPRDDESLVASGATRMRDDYFCRMFGLVTASQKAGGRLQGANFWAWEERRETGDGARLDVNAVLASDQGTMEVTLRHAKALLKAASPRMP
jgi:mannan endo-1,4-beta-mannosidase